MRRGNVIPEGPEILRSTNFLSRHLKGSKLVNVFPGRAGRYSPPNVPPVGFDVFLASQNVFGPAKVLDVACKGKFIYWTLKFNVNFVCPDDDHDLWYLWCTYGMSGQWSSQETKHSAFGVYFNESGRPEDYEALYFNDSRHFGTLKFVNSRKEHQKKLASLGPDMLCDPPSEPEFSSLLMKRSGRTLAEVLMNQSVISGVGNYVKAESLYAAGLSPHRVVASLSSAEVSLLREQIINVMKAAYSTGGATFSTYRNPDGTKGEAQRRFMVYGNKLDPMGNPVIREETLDGRTTHWVPKIQL